VRTPEERDRLTLAIVTALVRFLSVVACSWVVLAVLDLTIGVDDRVKVPLLAASVGLGLVALLVHLAHPGSRRKHGLRGHA
jgi:hypothetical protein